jgi:hypothetical protein
VHQGRWWLANSPHSRCSGMKVGTSHQCGRALKGEREDGIEEALNNNLATLD